MSCRLRPDTTSVEASRCNEALLLPLLYFFYFPLNDLVPVRGFAKGWCVKFEGIAA